MATITVRTDRLEELLHERGVQTNVAAGEVIGVDDSTISRMRSGKSEPGRRFIAQAIVALSTTFDDLFQINVDDDDIAVEKQVA